MVDGSGRIKGIFRAPNLRHVGQHGQVSQLLNKEAWVAVAYMAIFSETEE